MMSNQDIAVNVVPVLLSTTPLDGDYRRMLAAELMAQSALRERLQAHLTRILMAVEPYAIEANKS